MNPPNQILSELNSTYGRSITCEQLRLFCIQNGYELSDLVKLAIEELNFNQENPNTWNLIMSPTKTKNMESTSSNEHASIQIGRNVYSDGLVPKKDPNYVPFGAFTQLKKVIQSGLFFPVFITGLSGNGKTVSVEQVCALLKREMIRVNITIETDQDDLIGGFRLDAGSTVWHNGPVVEAMERGAILLLDEIDLASNKIMALQSVLEGKPLFLKKISKLVYPKPGFNIIATANTKGKGSEDGRFIGTNVLNEAFLERFSITLDQQYPSDKVETKILTRLAKSINVSDNVEDFIKRLVTWAGDTRKTFENGGIDELITTRRLVRILEAYKIFGNKSIAIEYAVSRFDDTTKSAFISQYDKIDETYRKEEEKARKMNEDPDYVELESDTESSSSIIEVTIIDTQAQSGSVSNSPTKATP